jgi:hypothetical protein
MGRGIIQRIFNEHYPAYRRTHNLSWRERWAAHNIRTCRTPRQGTHEVVCSQGDYSEIRNNSCKHRSCPLCGARETRKWIEAQQKRMLKCRYAHVIFTIPDLLHPLWLYNRAEFGKWLFQAAWGALKTFAASPRWLGAEVGAIGFFQSWGETLNTHVHLHMLLTAGGLTSDGQWVDAQHGFLFPARALSEVFRGKFRCFLLRALEEGKLAVPASTSVAQWKNLLNKLGRQKWNVRIQPPYNYPDGCVRYLARYLKQGPISEHRIQSDDRGGLVLKYKRPEEHKTGEFHLSAQEFIRRILVHAPARRFHAIRYFGLFHPRQGVPRAQSQILLGDRPVDSSRTMQPVQGRCDPPSGLRCPRCGHPLTIVRLDYPARASPERKVA